MSQCAGTSVASSLANRGATASAVTYPYFDFADFEEIVREACGKREENKFEPTSGKGAVARATLYFLLRSPGEINRTSQEIKSSIAWRRCWAGTRAIR